MFFQSIQQYERHLNVWSQQAAQHFLSWLNAASQKTWLETGCGTGILTAEIQKNATPQALHALDLIPQALHLAQQRTPEALFYHADALALPFAPASFDVLVSGLLFSSLSDPDWALRELCRVAKPKALLATYIWHGSAGFPFAPLLNVLRQHEVLPALPVLENELPALWQRHLHQVRYDVLDLQPQKITWTQAEALLNDFNLDAYLRQKSASLQEEIRAAWKFFIENQNLNAQIFVIQGVLP